MAAGRVDGGEPGRGSVSGESDPYTLLQCGSADCSRTCAKARCSEVGDLRVRLPRPAGLLIEKLLTERSGLKGERDLLVALGLLQVSSQEDLEDFVGIFAGLTSEQRGAVVSNLTVLSLMKPLPEMPDPAAGREAVAGLIKRLEAVA